jgi:exonuclease SbcC
MKLRELEIRLMPGLDQPFTVNFEPDAVNVITGPNASGKSSLIRAVRALLYPDQLTEFCHLRAIWERDGKQLACERRGSHVTWLENSAPTSRPSLPGADSLGAFLVSSEDLTALGSTDQHISAQLRTMLAGGYDLDAVLADGPLAPRSRPQKLARDLARLGTAVADKENDYAQLQDELVALERLNQELAATTDAASRLHACEDALALSEAIARRSAMEITLIQEYPGGMDRLRGDEMTRLDQAAEQLARREKELAIEQGSLVQAQERLEKTGTLDPFALEALQSELSNQRDRLGEIERRMIEHEDSIEQHHAALTAAARRLGSEQPQIAEKLDQEALEELEKLVERVQDLREQIRNLTAELARTHVNKNMTGRSQANLRDAHHALERWLEGARLSPLEGVLWGGLVIAAGIAAWRLLGVQDVGVSPELILLIAVAAGVPATLLGGFIHRWRDLGRARTDFLETDIEEPLGWVEAEVEARLERLEVELESATRHEVSQARAVEVREQLNSQRTSLEVARDRLRHFAAELGVGSDERLETGFLLWCRHLHDWQQQQRAWAGATRQLEQDRLRYAELQKETSKLLTRHGMGTDKPPTSRELAGLIHLLSPRMRRNAELHNQVHAHQRRIDELKADIAQLQRAHDQVFETAGIKANDRRALIQRSDQLNAWRELEQQRRDCSLEVARLEKRLTSDPTLLGKARGQQREDLEKLRDELAARVAQRDQLNRKIAEIHTRHGDVLKRRELEALAGEYELQRQSLDDELEQHLMAAAAESLLDDVRSAHQVDNEPFALARAGQWFDRITRHRYRLLFDRGQFAALDTYDNQRRGITELSTGTRVQLLLAVRLAWIERAEDQSEPLPVFLDEVLTTTDPDRYRAVVESVQEIVAGGRQMFYLTAQSDDARAWTQWAGDGPKPHVVDMAEVRQGQIEPLQYAMPIGEQAVRSIPDPSGMKALDWAEAVGVDAIDPWRDAGSIHPFHLLHDRLELAAWLMEIDLTRLGNLEAFLKSDKAGELIDDDDRDFLDRRLAAARLILNDWQQRHDRPVDESALHASGVISDNFMTRVTELAEKADGRPDLLIAGLKNGEVARFRSDNADQLEQWLRDQGYLKSENRSRLTAAEISLMANIDPQQVSLLQRWVTGAIRDPLGTEALNSDPVS